MVALFAVKQKPKAFYERFRDEQVQTHECTFEYAAITFREGLLPSMQVYKDLVRRPTKDMGEIQTRIEGEIRLEDIEAAQASHMIAAIVSRGQACPAKFGIGANTCGESKWKGERTSCGHEFQDPCYHFTVSPAQICLRIQIASLMDQGKLSQYKVMDNGKKSTPVTNMTAKKKKEYARYYDLNLSLKREK
ncbi:hypothetical protein M0R45_016294 [Rubus argutus]|uniref:Uncharacterized protein n=1 Tax=Rubus argutus TaxID=59490 RepID=A0AAW1XSY2_RUBAR